jgi:arylformamidase
MNVVDLSHFLEDRMPVFPGSKPVKLDQAACISEEGYHELELHVSTHTGTHIDCASHLIQGGFDTGLASPDRFYGKALVIDCTHLIAPYRIPLEHVKRYEEVLKKTEFVLLHTGWDRYWGKDVYFGEFPVLDPDAASYLAGWPLKGIGIDAAGFDPIDSHDLPVHRIFLSRNIVLVENLTRLADLPEGDFMFCCFPLKIKQGDGSPVRAVGIAKE